MSKTLLELKNIDFSVKYKSKAILKDISLKLEENDFLTIIGPNAAGKTTLLKIILNILAPTKGKITRSEDLKLAYIPQKIEVPRTLAMNAKYFILLNEKHKKSNFDSVVETLKIENLLKKQLVNLSGGEMQKILLAKALISEPNLLIMDEPAQNLDISGQLEFYELINKLHKQKKLAILMVSHDLHLVMSSTKKVICLFNHICCQGKPHAVSQDPKFVSLFGKNMNKLMSIYNHYHNHNHE
jgi:zinc transport system ATP-binding protein